MNSQFSRDLAIAGSFNVRDLGGYATAAQPTRWRNILRAGGMHALQPAGAQALFDSAITRVIDLRRADELGDHPNPLSATPGFEYVNVSLFEALAPGAMQEGDLLLDLYLQALSTRKEAFREVLRLIATAPQGVLFHCTAGKDRTGLIAMLLLGLAGVSHDDIIADYALTEGRIAPLLARADTEARARGTDPAVFAKLLACAPATMAATLDWIVAEHGSIPAYIDSLGLSPADLSALRARLTEVV